VKSAEQEYNNVLRCVEVDMLLKSLQRLEAKVRDKYYDYPYGEIEVPKHYRNYPYSYDEVRQLLEIIYTMLKRLQMYLESKGTYDYYYDTYFKPHYDLFNGLCEYFQVDVKEFEEDELSLLTEEEKREYELLRDLGQLTNHPELPVQYLKKVEWARKPFEERLSELINRWWEKRRAEQLSEDEPKYGAYTVKEWLQRLDLNEFQQEYAKRHPWLLASESGRSLLRKLEPHMVSGND